MYVRMSTESQDYSTDHQRAMIHQYAAANCMPIVREYVDDGKSGLDIKRRSGLLSLMQAVQSPQPDFTHIIVFDVSRWGRFQDIDEAAYYEHKCRRAGIKVVYCGEKFSDDTGPYAALLKSIKRIMAAEYSRELSEKVFIAQSRFIEMGFKQGGLAGYGFRRLAVKACGAPRAILEHGEGKITLTDRVVLIWGPDNEVGTIRRIYRLYLEDGMSEAGLARLLNNEHLPSELGRPWTQVMINSILTNVKYCGSLAYNRRSCRLSTPRTRNSQDKWIVNAGAVAPIIDAEMFLEVQEERARRQRRYGHEELLNLLRDCQARHGKVTASIIAADPAMPDPQLLVRSFGSLIKAYEAAGLPRTRSYAFVETKRVLARMREELLVKVIELADAAGAAVEHTYEPFVITLNGSLVVKVDVVPPRTPRRGLRNWRIAPDKGVDFCIVGRFVPSEAICDYYLVPATVLTSGPIYLKESNLHQYSAHRYFALVDMFGLVSQA
ncbi:recombinase family protein [Massilia agri]|uniref:Recombinase family protein n=2 Tax=Massilia agri TaxID=1886785 RepID=A0ABT2AT26_9BURK|nr:recombinase family protein [Massilia agri]